MPLDTAAHPLPAVEEIWKEYGLEHRTKFSTKVTSVRRISPKQKEREKDDSESKDARASQTPPRSEWIVNHDESTIFDAVIVCVGTCGEPKMIKLDGMAKDLDWSTLDNDDDSETSDSESSGEGKRRGEQQDIFSNPVIHSAALDVLKGDRLCKFKKIVVVGSGASGVEACETLLAKIGSCLSFLAQYTITFWLKFFFLSERRTTEYHHDFPD